MWPCSNRLVICILMHGKAETLIFENVAWQLHPPPRASHESDVIAIFGKDFMKRQLLLQIFRSLVIFQIQRTIVQENICL